MEVSMGLRLTILATAATLLPAAAMAQDMQPTSPAPTTAPAATATDQATPTAGQPADSPAATTATQTETAATTKVTKADVKAGAAIFDTSGNTVGKIDSVSAKGAVLNTGKVKVTVPISSLAKSDKGLVIAMTKAQVEAAAKKSG
jgi:hypothetical protein